MFGGSALTLDVGVVNATGAAVTEGMVLAIEMDDASAANVDGFRAQIPVLAAGNPEMIVTVHGAALVPTGQSIPDGENLTLRVVGPCKVRVDGNSQNIAVGDCLMIVNGSTDLVTIAAQPDLVGGALADVQEILKTKAIARGAATADNVLIEAWLKGLPV
tara:strand:- start:9 stop:488 length:480 start_codon:yes stop_codon:yes gene_type:complete